MLSVLFIYLFIFSIFSASRINYFSQPIIQLSLFIIKNFPFSPPLKASTFFFTTFLISFLVFLMVFSISGSVSTLPPSSGFWLLCAWPAYRGLLFLMISKTLFSLYIIFICLVSFRLHSLVMLSLISPNTFLNHFFRVTIIYFRLFFSVATSFRSIRHYWSY